jgi:hypothetical protein
LKGEGEQGCCGAVWHRRWGARHVAEWPVGAVWVAALHRKKHWATARCSL